VVLDESFADQQPFYARVTEAALWVDKERMQVLIDLYEHHQSLWNMKSAQYVNVLIKKNQGRYTETLWFAWYAPFSVTL